MENGIHTDYENLSKELFNIKILSLGTSHILTNVEDMIHFDWGKLNLNIIKKYPHIYKKLIRITQEKSIPLNDLAIRCVFPYIQLFLPENYNFIKKEIISKWVNKYKSKLQPFYDEDEFDLSWYEFASADCAWAYKRMQTIDKINKTIDEYVKKIDESHFSKGGELLKN